MGQRIIGGRLKGKKLFPIKGAHIRPTGDRQRQALFNILGHKVAGARVLDLYAGTGALGLEALSRGASECVFIDRDKSAAQVIGRNISACRFENSSNIIRWRIEKNLACLQTLHVVFDLVFMDPPYNRGFILPTLQNLHSAGCLKTGSTVIVEHSFDEKPWNMDDTYVCHDRRRYGKTLVSFLDYVV